jgi:hypothetical protein
MSKRPTGVTLRTLAFSGKKSVRLHGKEIGRLWSFAVTDYKRLWGWQDSHGARGTAVTSQAHAIEEVLAAYRENGNAE